MTYWLETSETMPKGLGFSHFDSLHLLWLAAFLLFTAAMVLLYQRLDARGREKMRKALALAVLADELFKVVCLFLGGNFTMEYLPLHLCSINIILIAIHAFHPSKVLDNFLYTVCIPGALAALLFPSWTRLPLANFMHIHSFTIHILLAAYPVILTAGGDIRPDPKYIPKCIGLLAALAAVALVFNLIFDTNFMFLMYATSGNPLYWFQKNMGSHLWGFAVLLPVVVGVMYAPWVCRLRRSKPAEA